jgi:hypothetical protein
MRLAGLFAVLAACGGTSRPAQVPAPTPPAQPAQPTCDEVGIILRGSVEDRDAGAGPAKEKAIAESCRRERWSIRVIACVAGTPVPSDCIKQLTAEQKQRYDERLGDWERHFAPDESAGYQDPPPPTCTEAIDNAEYLDPPIDDTSPEHDWELATRKRVLLAMCEHDAWSEETKTCWRDSLSVDRTVCQVDPGVHTRVLALRDLANSIATLRKTPKKLDCAKVVEHHYGDTTWKGKLPDQKPAERKKRIAESRTQMLDACRAENWDETIRACVIADGDDDECFGAPRWGYPVAAMVVIPECIDYAAAVNDLAQCAAVPQATRDALRDAVKSLDSATSSATPDMRATLATGCKAGADAVRQMASSYGC